jgi:nucleotide-binding universal stress UspA family protein
MVWSLPSPVWPAHLHAGGPGGAEIGAQMVDSLSDCVAKVDTTGVDVQLTVLEGAPARVLTGRVSGADLLVVGTRGLGRAREPVSGSVGRASPCRAR